MNFHDFKYKIVFPIILLSLTSSILLTFVPLSILCTPLEGCNAVQTSSYTKTAGIDSSYFGIIIFALMSLVAFSHIRKPSKKKKLFINMGIFIGTLISLYFLYLQQFVIHAWCKYCLVIDIGMIIAFVIINIPNKKKLEDAEINIEKEVMDKNVLRNS